MEDYAFQASFWDNLTMGGGEGKTIISLHLVIWKIKGIQLIQILNVYLHVLVLTMLKVVKRCKFWIFLFEI
jgi:hypothetical protein